jgi:hypothetical protein
MMDDPPRLAVWRIRDLGEPEPDGVKVNFLAVQA